MIIYGHIQLLGPHKPLVRRFELWKTEGGTIRGRALLDRGDESTAAGTNGVLVLSQLVEQVANHAGRSAFDFGVRLIDPDDDRVNVPYAQIHALKDVASLVTGR